MSRLLGVSVRLLVIFSLVLVVPAAGCRHKPAATAATPVALAAAVPAAATVWLDRVDRDIASVPMDAVPQLGLLRQSFFATQVQLLAPTEVRRGIALAMLDAEVRAGEAKNQSAEQVQGWRLSAAVGHALLHDADGARRWLAAADAPATTAPTTDPMVGLAAGFSEPARIETALLLGDGSLLDKAKLRWLGYAAMFDELAWAGHPAEARRVLDRERAQLADALAKPPVEYDDPGFDQEIVVEHLLTLGDRPAAFKAVAELAEMRRQGSTDWNGEHARRAYDKIAHDALQAGSREDYVAARRAAVDSLKRASPDQYIDWDRVDDWARLCVGADDREGFDAIAAIMQQAFRKKDSSDIRPRAALGQLYWSVGDRTAYQILIDGIDAELAQSPLLAAKGKRTLDDSIALSKHFLLAAARARAGDKAGVDREVLKVSKLDSGYDGDLTDGWNEIAAGYADAGLLDDAIAAERHAPQKEYRSVDGLIARRLAAAGRVDDAWTLVAEMEPGNRSDAEYQLAVEQTVAGNTEGLKARADAAPTPNEKALIDLAVARTLSGVPYGGVFRIYKPRDF